MKYSYNWLKQLVNFDKTPQELADDLSCKSIEIENIEKFGGDFLDTIVIGEILEIKPHPNADKLQIAMVDVGESGLEIIRENSPNSNNSHLTIVCGAPNIAVGQKVPVALVGTKLPGGEIKQAKIRDVDSAGMLCAPDEIGFGADHSGILVLDSELKIGTKLSEIYSDWILEGKVLSNRGDLQNHMQLAREIAAVYKLDFKEEGFPDSIKDTGESPLSIAIENLEACPYYSAHAITGIKVGPSPMWMQQRLLVCGMKPINNVVDITNYVMLEYGNPLHAFDAKKIPEIEGKNQIIVRLCKKGETLKTLDGTNHELPEGLLVIADHKNPIAVAGVMGGENSDIDESTKTIILESANFNQKFIRKSMRDLGLSTEASSRFTKDILPYLATICMRRATELFVEICEGKPVGGVVADGEFSNVKKSMPFDFEKIKEYISIDISKEEAIKILESIGFVVDSDNALIPLWRKDVSIWQDLAEEIGRIYGLDMAHENEVDIKIEPKTEKVLFFEQSTKMFMKSIGFTEIYNISMISSELAEKTKIKDRYFEITNPMNETDFVMRISLIPDLLNTAAQNAKKFDKFNFYELSKIYLPSDKEGIPAHENRMLTLLVYGEKADEGLFAVKYHVEHFATAYGLTLHYENYTTPKEFMHPGRCAKILFKGEAIGSIFEIHPIVAENLDLKNRCWVAELNFDALVADATDIENIFHEEVCNTIYKEFSRFEVSKRDIAVIVDAKADNSAIISDIKSIDERVVNVELFDEYVSDKFGEGKKSVAFHLTFQAQNRTLTDKEVDELFSKVLEILGKNFSAEIRR